MGVVIAPLMLLPLKRGFWELEKDLKNKERVIMACERKQLINDTDHHVAIGSQIRAKMGITSLFKCSSKTCLAFPFPPCHSIISSIQQTDHNTCTHRHTPSLVC